MNTTNFSYSEEAFLLNSLHEVVKVWASGKGKADFQLKIKMEQLSYSLPLGLDILVTSMLSHPSTTITNSSLRMISIMSNSFPTAAAVREQQDVRKIVLELRSIRLVLSLKNQLNQLTFFFPFVEESFL